MTKRRTLWSLGVGTCALSGALGAGVSLAHCSLYGESLLLPADDGSVAPESAPPAPEAGRDGPEVRDAATDADAVAEAESGAGCPLAHVPPPPSQNGPSPDGGELDLVLAFRLVDFGGGATEPPDAAATLGYDLDGLCTCPDPGDCKPTSSATKNCDEPGGRDNAGAALLRKFYGLSGGQFFSQDGINAAIGSGQSTLLLEVQHYNGTPNDTSVTVSAYVSDGTPIDDAGVNTPPTWTGNDTWVVDPGSVLFGGMGYPKYVATTAYVTGGVLVATGFTFVLPLPISSVDVYWLDEGNAALTATLVDAGGVWTLGNGALDGRVAATDVLDSLRYVHDPQNTSAFLCPQSSSYQNLKTILFCPALDVTADPSAPMSMSCDGMSFGFGFAAASARIGPIGDAGRATTCDGGPDHC